MNKIFLIFLLCFQVLAQEEVPLMITCDDVSCLFDSSLNVVNENNSDDFLSFNILSNQDDLEISKVQNSSNMEVRSYILNNSIYGKNFSVNFSSTKEDEDASNFVMVTDILSNLDINLDGIVGIDGKSTNLLCAENFLSGAYGDEAMDYFTQRRVDNSDVSSLCDDEDILWLDEHKFTCPSGYIEHDGVVATVERIKKQRKCISTGVRSRCVRRTFNIICKSYQTTVTGQCCNSPRNNWFSGSIDSVFVPEPLNWSCDPSLCDIKIENGNSYFLNGMSRTSSWNVPEFIYNQGNQVACNYAMGDSPDVGWATWVYSIPGDTNSPLIEGNRSYVKSVSLSGSNTFEIPAPDRVDVPSSGDNWEYSNRRYAIDTSKSTVSIKDCLGLTGSSGYDITCVKNPGAAGKLYIYPLDEYGRSGKEIRLDIPESPSYKDFYYINSNVLYESGIDGGRRSFAQVSPDNFSNYAVLINFGNIGFWPDPFLRGEKNNCNAYFDCKFPIADVGEEVCFGNGNCNEHDLDQARVDAINEVAGTFESYSSSWSQFVGSRGGFYGAHFNNPHIDPFYTYKQKQAGNIVHCNNLSITEIKSGSKCYFNVPSRGSWVDASILIRRVQGNSSCGSETYYDPGAYYNHYWSFCREKVYFPLQ